MALATLSIDLVAKLADFERSMGIASRIAEKNANSIARSLGSIKTLMGGTAAYLTVDGFVGLVKSTAEAEDQLGKMSQKTGIAVEDLSKLQYAAKLSNVSAEQLQQGLVKLSRGMIDTANDSGEARNALVAMGISIKNSDGSLKSNADVLGEIADKFSGYQDGATKAALATKLFGKSGAELIPFLNGGSKAIADAGQELGLLGGVINKEMVKNATEFNDNMARLDVVAGAAGKAIANSVIPYINQLATEFMVAKANGLGFMDMLAMGFRSTDYAKQLKDINDEINLVNQAWAFPIGPSRDERLASLERQKKAIIDIQTLMMKDQLMGPDKPKEPLRAAPIPIDLDKLRRAKEAVEEIVIGASNTIQKEGDKIELSLNTAFESEQQKKLASDIQSVTNAVRDRQEQIAKLLRKGDLDAKGAEEAQKRLNQVQLLGIERVTALDQKQQELNYTFEYGAINAVSRYINEVNNLAKQVDDTVSRAFKGLEDQMVSVFTTGKLSFTNMANSIISDMARIVIRQSITGPLAGMFGSLFGGRSDGGTATVHDYSSVLNTTTQANGGAWINGIQRFAKGSAFLNSIVSSPTLFKFANGTGLMGEAGPEAILPLSRNAKGQLGVASSGGSANITIINQAAPAGYEAVASAKQNDSGLNVEVLIRKVFSGDLNVNGPLSKQFSNTFGLRRSI